MNYQTNSLTQVDHYAEYLTAPFSEPSTRGPLKTLHGAILFLEDMSGTQADQRVKSSAVYEAVRKETLDTR